MRCPICGVNVAESSSFCHNCGAVLGDGPSESEDPGHAKKKEGQPAEHSVRRNEPRVEKPSILQGIMDRGGEALKDLAHVQMVIIAARWVLIAAGFGLAIVKPEDGAINELRLLIVVILGLAVANFYLHTQVLMKKPVLAPVVYAASIADLVAISLIVMAKGGGLAPHYVFYFPAILAFTVAFRAELTLAFAGSAILAYGLISAGSIDAVGAEVIVVRMLMMAAVAVCGSKYWGIERRRRAAAEEARDALKAQVGQQALTP